MAFTIAYQLPNPADFEFGNTMIGGEMQPMEIGNLPEYDLSNDKCTAIICWFKRSTQGRQEFIASKGAYIQKEGWRMMVKDDTKWRYDNWQQFLDWGYDPADQLNSFQYNQIQLDVADTETYNYYKGIDSIDDSGVYDHFVAFLWDPKGAGFTDFFGKSVTRWDTNPGALVLEGKTDDDDKMSRLTCDGAYAQATYNANPDPMYLDNQRNCDQVIIRDCTPHTDKPLVIGRNCRVMNPDDLRYGLTGTIYEFEIWQGDAPGAITMDDIRAFFQRTMSKYALIPDAAPLCPGEFECPETPPSGCPDCVSGQQLIHTCTDGGDVVVAECVDEHWITYGLGCEDCGEDCPPCPDCPPPDQPCPPVVPCLRCTEGETLTYKCEDGMLIVLAECVDNKWVMTGTQCPCIEEEVEVEEDSNLNMLLYALIGAGGGYLAAKKGLI